MTYEIIKNATPPRRPPGTPKSEEREAMETLEIGDAIMVSTEDLRMRCENVRKMLKPKRFSIHKVPKIGWMVRREE